MSIKIKYGVDVPSIQDRTNAAYLAVSDFLNSGEKSGQIDLSGYNGSVKSLYAACRAVSQRSGKCKAIWRKGEIYLVRKISED